MNLVMIIISLEHYVVQDLLETKGCFPLLIDMDLLGDRSTVGQRTLTP